MSDTVFNECRKGFYPTAFGMWNVFSPCFDWMGLVADLCENTEVNSCSSNTTWWYLGPARGADEVGTGNFLQLWCGYQCSPNPVADSIPQTFLEELKNMRTCNATSPGWQFGLWWGAPILGVPQHSVGSNAHHGFACLLLPGSKIYC